MDSGAIRQLLDNRDGRVPALLDALGPERAAEFAAASRLGGWRRNEQVHDEGDEAPDVGFVIDGALGMTKRLPGGPSHIVGLLMPGDMFGRLGDGSLTYRLEALADSTALLVPRPVFDAVVAASIEAERLLLVAMLDELDAAREWLVLMGTHSAAERLAGFLLHLIKRRVASGRAAPGGRMHLDLPLRRVDLARHLGVRPESLSRAFRRLQREGILRGETATTVAIDDLDALVALSGEEAVLRRPEDGRGEAERDRKR